MKTLILTIVFASLVGCYSKKQLQVAIDKARLEACFEKDVEISEKTERLRRFNQINPDGSLR